MRTDNETIIYDIHIPKKPLWCKLLFLKFPLLIPGFVQFVKKKLKFCSNVYFTYGFKCFYGNIHGKNCSLGDTFFMDYAPIYLGDGVTFSLDNMVITSTHDYPNFDRIIAKPIKIGGNTWITSRCTILGGVTIGENSLIGAGSVVVSDIPSNCFAAGNPCKVIKYFDKTDKNRKLSTAQKKKMA